MPGNVILNLAGLPAGIYTWVLEAGGARCRANYGDPVKVFGSIATFFSRLRGI